MAVRVVTNSLIASQLRPWMSSPRRNPWCSSFVHLPLFRRVLSFHAADRGKEKRANRSRVGGFTPVAVAPGTVTLVAGIYAAVSLVEVMPLAVVRVTVTPVAVACLLCGGCALVAFFSRQYSCDG